MFGSILQYALNIFLAHNIFTDTEAILRGYQGFYRSLLTTLTPLIATNLDTYVSSEQEQEQEQNNKQKQERMFEKKQELKYASPGAEAEIREEET